MSAEPCDHAATPTRPAATRCSNCPPQQCNDCGQMDHPTAPCACWLPVDGLPLADLKALFATADMEVIK